MELREYKRLANALKLQDSNKYSTWDNIMQLWFDTKFKGARGYVASAFQNIGSWFGDKRIAIQNNMSSISTWFKDTFRKAYDGITGIFDNIGSYFSKVAGWIETPIKNALNGVREAVNWIYGKLGGNTQPMNRICLRLTVQCISYQKMQMNIGLMDTRAMSCFPMKCT